MKKITLIIICFTIAFPVFSEVILLKSGQTIEGTIVERNNDFIKVDYHGIPLVYYFDQIESIDVEPIQNEYEGINSSIVKIFIDSSPELKKGYRGIGLIVHEKGVILTNFHIAAISNQCRVLLNNGSEYIATSVIHYDPLRDICLLKIDADNLPFVSLKSSENIRAGDEVYVLKDPLAKQFSFSEGLISFVDRTGPFTTFNVFAIGPISQGHSGSPVLNKHKEVIGIISDGIIVNWGDDNWGAERFWENAYVVPSDEISPYISTIPRFSLKDVLTYNKVGLNLYKAKFAFLRKDYQQAINYYKNITKSDPNFYKATMGLGSCHLNLQHYPEAKKYYKSVLGIKPNFFEANMNLSLISIKEGNLQQAVFSLEKIVQKNKYLPGAHFTLAMIYYDIGQIQKAKSSLLKARELYSRFGSYVGPLKEKIETLLQQ